ncbi:MAG: 5-formyltetrahydrofolate cyclo-ligase [Acutalibacteraceae bacterium]
MFLKKDIRQEKNAIRSECRQYRADMGEADKQKLDTQIFNRFINLWRYRECKTLLTYVSSAIEVDTRVLISDALKRGKRVAVPRCIPGIHEMEFYYITSFGDLEKGAYGVLEPVKSKCRRMTDYSEGLCVIPALAFDENGYRLGFGKGYYDRFLSRFRGDTVGICYECCMQKQLPRGRFDRCADIVVTEKRVISNG